MARGVWQSSFRRHQLLTAGLGRTGWSIFMLSTGHTQTWSSSIATDIPLHPWHQLADYGKSQETGSPQQAHVSTKSQNWTFANKIVGLSCG